MLMFYLQKASYLITLLVVQHSFKSFSALQYKMSNIRAIRLCLKPAVGVISPPPLPIINLDEHAGVNLKLIRVFKCHFTKVC